MNKAILIVLTTLFAGVSNAEQYSKLSIITAAKASGKWQTIKTFIEANDLVDEWQAASFISDEHPAFVAATNAVVLAGVATSDEIASFLYASRDFAVPDELFARYYASQMSNATERIKWHGGIKGTPHYDASTRTKTTCYADGFVWTQPYSYASPRSRDERISDAERKARHEEAVRKAAELAENARLARIALLTTNLTAEVHALMTKRHWPEELATLYLKNELNTLATNIVNDVIMPQ